MTMMSFGKCVVTWAVALCVVLLLFAVLTEAGKCETCERFVTEFKAGMKRTHKSNFGGGNTHWEEKSLGSWATSETRLIDIMDEIDADKDCHLMIERYEEIIEDYWFKVYGKNIDEDLHSWFCIDKIKVCCPENKYGPNCTECAGGTERPCKGNGKCDGAGTREGKGTCNCDAGYKGDLCDECQSNYYRADHNDTHTECKACHRACLTCLDDGPDKCISCKAGYRMEESQCKDIQECEEDSSLCSGFKERCVNNEGSYTCLCESGFKRQDDKCVEESEDKGKKVEDSREEEEEEEEEEKEEVEEKATDEDSKQMKEEL